jgi:reactive intermediate/imine deaminase
MSKTNLAVRHIVVPALPKMRARISHAVVFGDTVTVSGMVGRDPDTGTPLDGVAAQTRQVLEYVRMVLEAAGSNMSCVAKTGCFLRSMDDFDAFNAVWESYFPDSPPARICVQAALGPGFDVEIDAIAWVAQ